MRTIYFDAAGISNPKHEPYIVVAGVIVHGDKQWRALSDYLSTMADTFAPPENRAGFAFHATELFSGGKIFPRETYPKEWRWAVLDELVSIPEKFDLPITWGCIRHDDVLPGGKSASKGGKIPAVVHGQIMAFIVASAGAEHWMQVMASDEVASMSMEDDHQSRKFVKETQRLLSDPRYYDQFPEQHRAFKLSRIIYPIHFEEKTDASALQIADVCAFSIKRWLMGTPESERFYRPIERFLVHKISDAALTELRADR